MRILDHCGILAAFVFLPISLVAHAPANGATIRPLGLASADGRRQTLAHGISADGRVVAASSGSLRTWYYEPYLWTSSGGFQQVLPNDSENFAGLTSGISADGTALIGATGSLWGDAFVWSQQDGFSRLVEPNPEIWESRATSVSNGGQVVVGYVFTGAESQTFRWTREQGAVPIRDLIGESAWASAVTPDGSFLLGGIATQDGTGLEAMRWSASGGVDRIGDLPGGSVNSGARGASADGRIAFGSSSSASSGDSSFEAFRWIEGQGMVGLGDLPGSVYQSSAWAMNADGSVIVGTSKVQSSGDYADEAFIWDETHGMRSLREMLITDYGLGAKLANWHFSTATGISADGKIIVGYGIGPTWQWERGLSAFIIDLRSCTGDTNFDCIVDLEDLNNVRNNFGGAGLGDADGDNDVDLDDLNAVRNNFGASAGISAVPEPSGLVLLATLLLAVVTSALRCSRVSSVRP